VKPLSGTNWIKPAKIDDRGCPCTYCGRVCRPPQRGEQYCKLKKRIHAKSVTIDHFVPFAAGGRDTLDNRTPACRLCNQAKGALPALLFIAQRGLGSRVPPSQCGYSK
jgi:hypothetical protein